MDAVLQNFRRSFGPSTPFFHSLLLEPLVTMEELYRRVDKYSTLEDNIRIAAQTVIITNQSAEGNKLSGKKSSEPKEGQSKDQKRSRDQSQKNREPLQFTLLNVLYERLLPLICDLTEFKWPALIQMDPSQRNRSLRCDYHRDHRHETDRCRSLKFLVEKLIKVGHLRRYIREIDQGEEPRQDVDRITVGAVAPLKSRPSINYILGGPFDNQYQSKHQQKKLLRAAIIKARVNAIHT